MGRVHPRRSAAGPLQTRRRAIVARPSLVAFVVGLSLALTAPSAEAGSTPRLLLLPIVVHSAEDPAYLREGLADMLNARLSRIGAIELVAVDPSLSGTTQLARAREAARRLGADYVLFGSFTRFGQGASLDVQCASADPAAAREPLREIFVHSGSIGDIIPDLDELAGKVSRFARGEVVAASTAAPAAAAAGAGAVSLREYQALANRVASLEKSLADLTASKKAKRE